MFKTLVNTSLWSMILLHTITIVLVGVLFDVSAWVMLFAALCGWITVFVDLLVLGHSQQKTGSVNKWGS